MISVVVPVYKSEQTLERCVESLLSQTCEDIEILLVDDGSPDRCPVLCDFYAARDSRVKVIHKTNGGVSTARNAGIRNASGTYVAFVDSDDYVEPDYCEKLLDAMEKAADGIAICGYHHHYVGNDVEKCPAVSADLPELYGTGFLNMPWNKLFLRERLGIFPEDLDLGEDLLFNLDYLRQCKQVSLVKEPLYHYIQNESGKTLSSQKRENKLELAKMIRLESGRFFREWTGNKEEARIQKIVDTRFLCECLDEVERLPFDKDMTGKEKRWVIRRFVRDKEVQEALKTAEPASLDYRILKWCMRHGLIFCTWVLSGFRGLVVQMVRRMR